MKKISNLLVLVLVVSSLFGCTQGADTTAPSTTVPTTTTPITTTTQPISTPNNELGLGAIDWTLTVTPISEAGQPLDGTYTFTVNGEISDASEDSVNMLLNFSADADLPYLFYPSELTRPHSKTVYRHLGYYTYWDWYFMRNAKDDFHMMYCAIDPMKGFAIFYFGDGSGRYYVGSVEPDTDPLSIYEHFSRFVAEHNPVPGDTTE